MITIRPQARVGIQTSQCPAFEEDRLDTVGARAFKEVDNFQLMNCGVD
jgi:hypothetical protein